jgi:hypothetical protein
MDKFKDGFQALPRLGLLQGRGPVLCLTELRVLPEVDEGDP